jgi:hypothetical protein
MSHHKKSIFFETPNVKEEESKDLFERVLRLEIASLKPQDDVAPHLPLLCRLALAQEARPQDVGPFPELGSILQAFPEADKCREYASIDWEAVCRPIQKELDSLTDGFATSGPGIALSLGDSLAAEFERVDAQSRMMLLVSELVRIVREAAISQDAYSELLSSKGLHMEISLMLPMAYGRISKYVKLGSLLVGLSRIDHSYVLLTSLLCNLPGFMNKATPIIVSAAQRAAEEAREVARSIGGIHATYDRDMQTWWTGALTTMGSLSLVSAYRIRGELVGAAILPNIVMQLTLEKIRDPLVFLLGTIQGHEWLWEYIHYTVQDTALSGSNNPVQRLRNDMSTELERQTKPQDTTTSQQQQLHDDEVAMHVDEDANNTDTSSLGLGLLDLLRLYSVMVAYGGMQLSMVELTGEPPAATTTANNNNNNTNININIKPAAANTGGGNNNNAGTDASAANTPPRAGLLGILSGAIVPTCKSSRSYAQQARQLALCVLVLWPRLKVAVPPQSVTSAIKAMWADGHSWDGKHSQLILQFATYLVTREYASVGGWVRSATGLTSNIQGDSLTKLADMVMEGTDVRQLSRAIMCATSATGASTSDSDRTSAHYKPQHQGTVCTSLHCIQALLRNDKFLQTAADSEAFSQWLIGQMSRARAPLDPLLPPLVEEAAKRSTTDGNVAVSLPVSELRGLISGFCRGGTPGAVLAAYYLLCRKSALVRKRMDDHFVQRRRHAKRGGEVCVCVYVCDSWSCFCLCMNKCIRMHMYTMCACMYTYKHTYILTYIHTYIHTCRTASRTTTTTAKIR